MVKLLQMVQQNAALSRFVPDGDGKCVSHRMPRQAAALA